MCKQYYRHGWNTRISYEFYEQRKEKVPSLANSQPNRAAPPAAMPKKMGVNTKAEAARARRSAAKADRRDRNAHTKGEAYWQAAEGPKSHSARRHEEDAKNRRLAELE